MKSISVITARAGNYSDVTFTIDLPKFGLRFQYSIGFSANREGKVAIENLLCSAGLKRSISLEPDGTVRYYKADPDWLSRGEATSLIPWRTQVLGRWVCVLGHKRHDPSSFARTADRIGRLQEYLQEKWSRVFSEMTAIVDTHFNHPRVMSRSDIMWLSDGTTYIRLSRYEDSADCRLDTEEAYVSSLRGKSATELLTDSYHHCSDLTPYLALIKRKTRLQALFSKLWRIKSRFQGMLQEHCIWRFNIPRYIHSYYMKVDKYNVGVLYKDIFAFNVFSTDGKGEAVMPGRFILLDHLDLGPLAPDQLSDLVRAGRSRSMTE